MKADIKIPIDLFFVCFFDPKQSDNGPDANLESNFEGKLGFFDLDNYVEDEEAEPLSYEEELQRDQELIWKIKVILHKTVTEFEAR